MATKLNFITLPDSIKTKIISYLPQQSLINLSQTNYEFYQPCLKKLYSKILISEVALLISSSKREIDFQSSNKTVIYGFLKSAKDEKLNLKMINARILVLIQALRINVELIGYVKEIYIMGAFNEEIRKNLQELINLFSTLNVCHILNKEVRLDLDLSHLQLKSVIVDKKTEVLQTVEELIVGENETLSLSYLIHINSLIIAKEDPIDYYNWYEENVIKPKHFLKHLCKFRLVFHPTSLQKSNDLISRINWLTIKELEIIVPYSETDENFVLDCLDSIPPHLPNLKKLSIIQGTTFPTHASNESFDLNIFNFILSNISNLSYLSIKHNTPQFGNFSDGMEGNYHRRYEIYMVLLPKIIMNSTSPNFILNLPNLFQTFACYEQSMNTILWNGCKCKYCNIHLEKLDNFLFHHKYYSKKSGKFKDINVSHLMSFIGYELNQRQLQYPQTQLDQLSFPLFNKLWDFHTIPHSKDLKCLSKQTIDYGEYEDEDTIEEASKHCEFNKSIYQFIPLSISHYINNLVQEVLNLNRGNAEARIDEVLDLDLKDGGDLNFSSKFNLKKIIMNGFVYNFGNEINGTHFYENVYN
ncbi:hypothetical protein KGF54_005298 [Candida jiufengensis]|uniref:uncharacterized protein n=1 Tax=Candida jiufengensis TaxID=497108 RepID=UPI0022244AD4|nr:uncharacterized protein KGF54_005298 [Candida jiufengensis]KAI5950150.1 hypothetical protein KGF54_005298 [Candida jiufengensis]